MKRKFQAFFIIALSTNGRSFGSEPKNRGPNPCGADMKKEDYANIYKEVYEFVLEHGADMAASELSQIVHMASNMSKEEIVVRCTAIRNALWDI